MRNRKASLASNMPLAIFAATLLLTAHAAVAQVEKVLYSFGGNSGSLPYASLVFDAAGHLYGTTELGGTSDVGSAFEITH